MFDDECLFKIGMRVTGVDLSLSFGLCGTRHTLLSDLDFPLGSHQSMMDFSFKRNVGKQASGLLQ